MKYYCMLRHLRFLLVLIAVHICGLHPAFAASSISLPRDLKQENLFGKMEFIADADHVLTLDQVRALPAARFTPLVSDKFNPGFTAASYWIKARIVNEGTEPIEWVLKQLSPIIDYAEFHVIVDGEIRIRSVGGDRTLSSERQIPYRFPAVRYTSAPGEHAEIYIRLRNENPAFTLMLFELRSSADFVRNMTNDQMLLGVLYGMPLTLSFMALVGWVVKRDRRFGLYGAYALCILGTWMGMNGVLGDYLFIDSPALANSFQIVFLLAAIFFSAIFSRDFLRTRELVPVADWYFRILAWTSAIAILLRFAGVYTPVTRFAIFLAILDALSPLAGWLALRRGVSYARWYVIAQMLYSSMAVFSVWLAQVTAYQFGGFIIAEIAFFGQLLLLSVAQYDRMRVLQKEKDSVEQLYQNELQHQVEERTRDLEQARRHAEIANRSKSEFMANMSHEIRTPVNAILGFATLTQRTDLTLQQSDYLKKIHAATNTLSHIIDGLLDFSKLESGQMKIFHTRFALKEIIDAVANEHGALAARKGLTWKLTMGHDADLLVFGDGRRLQQVLEALCSNAIKFTTEGEVELSVRVKSRWGTRATLMFAIRDTGIGVSTEQAQRFFQPFVQADMSTTRRFGGTGLGLTISQRLLDMMKGKIWLESQPGKGTTFFVELELSVDTLVAASKVGGDRNWKDAGHRMSSQVNPEPETLQTGGTTESIQQWIGQVERSFNVVQTALAPLVAAVKLPAPAAGATPVDRDFLERTKDLLQELKRCLEQNNTRADEIIVQLHDMAGGKSLVWLQELTSAVEALEYEVALASLRKLES